MDKELQAIFENVDKEILTEDTLNAISKLVEEKVESAAKDRITLEVESAVKAKNEEDGQKMKRILEAIDKDHTSKVKTVVEKLKTQLNEDHVAKLNLLKSKYDKLLKETAVQHRDALIESVNDWIDSFLTKNLPREQIAEAAKNKYIEKVLAEARQVLSVDPSVVKENVRTALKDGKQQMDKLIRENAELKKQTVVSESARIIAEKTASLPHNVARFVRSRLENKEPEFIKNNFKYVVEMFERSEEKEKRSTRNTKPVHVDRQGIADDLIKEETESSRRQASVLEESVNPMMDAYLEGMNYEK